MAEQEIEALNKKAEANREAGKQMNIVATAATLRMKAGVQAWNDVCKSAVKHQKDLKTSIASADKFYDSLKHMIDNGFYVQGDTGSLCKNLDQLIHGLRELNSKREQVVSILENKLVSELKLIHADWKKDTPDRQKKLSKETSEAEKLVKKESKNSLKLKKKNSKDDVMVQAMKALLASEEQYVKTEKDAAQELLKAEFARFGKLAEVMLDISKTEVAQKEALAEIEKLSGLVSKASERDGSDNEELKIVVKKLAVDLGEAPADEPAPAAAAAAAAAPAPAPAPAPVARAASEIAVGTDAAPSSHRLSVDASTEMETKDRIGIYGPGSPEARLAVVMTTAKDHIVDPASSEATHSAVRRPHSMVVDENEKKREQEKQEKEVRRHSNPLEAIKLKPVASAATASVAAGADSAAKAADAAVASVDTKAAAAAKSAEDAVAAAVSAASVALAGSVPPPPPPPAAAAAEEEVPVELVSVEGIASVIAETGVTAAAPVSNNRENDV